MPTIVQKFGGSSLADVRCIQSVAAKVMERHQQGNRVVVVVSAMGKTTDELLTLAQTVSPNPPQRELDMLVTAGERISMALLSMAIHDAGGDSISFTGSQSGIITENAHQGARILEIRPYRLIEELERGRIVIVAGFQGVSRNKEVTTLGRGGSDTTAVALAAALEAEACEIYSDVDGVYTADPRVCPQAKLLKQVSYETMQAMAASGAKVLHAEAVEFARRAGIAIYARKTNDDSGRQTMVTAGEDTSRIIHAVVSTAKVTQIHGAAQHWQHLSEKILTLGGRMMAMSFVDGTITVLVDRTGMISGQAATLKDIADQAKLHSQPVSVVSLIGHGLGTCIHVWSCVDQILKDLSVPCLGTYIFDQFFQLVIPAELEVRLVQALHHEFIEHNSVEKEHGG